MKSTFIFVVIIFSLTCGWGHGKTAQSPVDLLTEGLEKFRAGDYQSALRLFEDLIRVEKNNPYLDAGLYLAAKSNIRLGQHIAAYKAVNSLISRFPQSAYIDDAAYLQAEILYALGKDEKAYQKLFCLLEDDIDPALKSLAEDKLRLLLGVMSKNRLLELRDSSSPEGKIFIDKLLEKRERFDKIIVLAAADDSVSRLIIQGMEVALKVSKNQTGFNGLKLEVVEIEGNPLDIYLTVKSLESGNGGAIISLLSGTNSLVAAGAASHLDAPFFILLDDTPGLWKVGDNIWQLPPDMESMGEALAEFAVDSLGLRRFVTLAPIDDSRSYFADAFIEKIDELGAEIACQEWFYLNTLDLGNHFKAIRSLGFRYSFDDSITALLEKDSLYVGIEYGKKLYEDYLIRTDTSYFKTDTSEVKFDTSYYKIDGSYFDPDSLTGFDDDSLARVQAEKMVEDLLFNIWTVYRQSLIQKARFQRVAVDSNDITLSCYDGFIFPLAGEEVDMYIPQYAFYNFNTNLFSLNSAFTPENLDKYGHYLNGLKTVGWGWKETESKSYGLMLENFLQSDLFAPTNEEALGYDGLNLILSMMNELNDSEESFSYEGFSFTGVVHDFFFPPGCRNNRRVDFFEFTGGRTGEPRLLRMGEASGGE